MAKISDTAADILAKWNGEGTCNIKCRLCGRSITADPPATIWIGTDGLGMMIDEHEQCDRIETALRKVETQALLGEFFEKAGIKPDDHERAREVLRLCLERGNIGSPFPAY